MITSGSGVGNVHNDVAAISHGFEVVAAARNWLGTPYHHQASKRGLGCDCLGLVRGVWRDCYGFDAEVAPAYTRDWAEARGEETLLAAASRHLVRRNSGLFETGDILIFRYARGLPAKHAAIATSATHMIHAIEKRGVVEVAIVPAWRRRIAGVFAFPGVDATWQRSH
ncbi:MAG: NlpC/P60 family protein [Pseudomonadota bacterium]